MSFAGVSLTVIYDESGLRAVLQVAGQTTRAEGSIDVVAVAATEMLELLLDEVREEDRP